MSCQAVKDVLETRSFASMKGRIIMPNFCFGGGLPYLSICMYILYIYIDVYIYIYMFVYTPIEQLNISKMEYNKVCS